MDRNAVALLAAVSAPVALRKESVDRNFHVPSVHEVPRGVALRKESVDRNIKKAEWDTFENQSLSARRAWIEIRR